MKIYSLVERNTLLKLQKAEEGRVGLSGSTCW